MDFKYEKITEAIIGSSFEVHKTLGYGFLEKVYQRALQVELLNRNYSAELEYPLKFKYKGTIVGEYQADLLVNEKVLVELKVAKEYSKNDEPQLLNEL